MRRSLWLLLVLLSACGAPVVPDAGLTDAGVTDAGVASDAGSSADAGVDAGVVPGDAGVVTTVLRVTYTAGAHTVFVRGSLPPLDWNTGVPMVKENDTTWSLALTGLPAGAALEWKPLLNDTTWSKGPNYRAAGGGTVQVAPRFLRDAGEWSRRWPSFASTLLMNTRGVYVYLPPTYLENTTASMPVVYMHDGQNLFDPQAAFGGVTWRVPEAMNDAASSGRFREAIVIGVENAGGARIDEYTPTVDTTVGGGGRGDLYLRMLVEELKPMVDSSYRTRSGPRDTVLIGSSLGGLISSYAGISRAGTFGCIGAMSPSVWWDNRVLLARLSQTGTTRPALVYVDSGDSGPSNDGVGDTADLAAAYRSLGYVEGSTLRYVVQQGATHTESAWASRLPGALEFLLGPGR